MVTYPLEADSLWRREVCRPAGEREVGGGGWGGGKVAAPRVTLTSREGVTQRGRPGRIDVAQHATC